MADGRVAPMRTGRVSVVFALAVAVRAIGLDTADHHLDGECYSHVYGLASAHTWTSVCAPPLDYGAGVWSRRDDRWNRSVAANRPMVRAAEFNRISGSRRDWRQSVLASL